MTPNQFEQMRAYVGDEALEQAVIHGPDERAITCDECGGDGGCESMPYGVNYHDGSALTHWIVCEACCGTGEIVVEMQPVELDDDQINN